MNREQPQVAREGRYPVCEAARRLGCDRRTLHRYADKVNVRPRLNPINKRAFFTGDQVIRIWRAAN